MPAAPGRHPGASFWTVAFAFGIVMDPEEQPPVLGDALVDILDRAAKLRRTR